MFLRVLRKQLEFQIPSHFCSLMYKGRIKGLVDNGTLNNCVIYIFHENWGCLRWNRIHDFRQIHVFTWIMFELRGRVFNVSIPYLRCFRRIIKIRVTLFTRNNLSNNFSQSDLILAMHRPATTVICFLLFPRAMWILITRFHSLVSQSNAT